VSPIIQEEDTSTGTPQAGTYLYICPNLGARSEAAFHTQVRPTIVNTKLKPTDKLKKMFINFITYIPSMQEK